MSQRNISDLIWVTFNMSQFEVAKYVDFSGLVCIIVNKVFG